ncbi:hypothetical protein Ancab_026854 [Ancistrocladus abbreviatus]
MKKAELVVIPMPGMSHLIPAVEIAKRLIERDERISITVLVMKLSHLAVDSFIESIEADATVNKRIKFIVLPELESPTESNFRAFRQMVVAYKPIVKQVVQEQVIVCGGIESQSTHQPGQLAGFVVDLFCSPMIDVASELDVPSYLFFTSGAAFLSLMFHLQSLRDEHCVEVSEALKDPDTELDIPGFRNRVPTWVFPSIFLEKEALNAFLDYAKRYRRAKGVMVNTLMELESYAIQTLSDDASVPPIYPVGPTVNLNPQNEGPGGSQGDGGSIMRWLDNQPPSSVVFLCFGSKGSFSDEQAREVAKGLDQSGYRFLWSLRRPSSSDTKLASTHECDNLEDVLPEGFLERTAEIGKIIGWAPQVAILSHPAVGGFVSHCGWNSTLESLWFGVPIAAWPMYAEQQTNAFQLTREMGLAVEVQLDYQSSNRIVEAAAIEKGVRRVMDMEHEARSKVKEISDIFRKTMAEGGSSYNWLGRFIEDVFHNVPL